MILAGDLGGTKTLIGLFTPAARRPVEIRVQQFVSADYAGLPAMIAAFLAPEHPRLSAAAFGVAGPVIGRTSKITHLPWSVDATELERLLHLPRVGLMNDLEATAHAVAALNSDELHTLQPGNARADGHIAVVAAGTGLGGSVLLRGEGGVRTLATEMGHSDFAARGAREHEFVRFLESRQGRVTLEHVTSGPGLANLADFTHQHNVCAADFRSSAEPDAPKKVSGAALAKRCPQCSEALSMFAAAYGAVAGNLALTAVCTGGLYVAGGIAARILPALTDGTFLEAFNDKAPMGQLLQAMPVQVVLNPQAGLLGAAVAAQHTASG